MELLLTKTSQTKLPITILLLLVLTPHVHSTSSSSKPSQASLNFIRQSCNTTTYPSQCIKTLTPYASSVGTNPLKLCNAALAVAIKATSNCSATVSKLWKQKGITRAEGSAIKECIGELKDAVYELKETVSAMGHLGDADREFQWANAKTYASAAITDAETCIDGFLGRKVSLKVKRKIRGCVSEVEKHISNALSLINHLY
ncbi:pectinesterase inhibitor 4-like [Sesamum indicum]|uniref:Pectinesterase inhibitor 4-like n=1 Tax=Sesamum indicum TaxID=4182 RepID=A0A6I9UKV5_SESIN|nr:pectinesterase inhibitor 4-like [Sesamum indicum]